MKLTEALKTLPLDMKMKSHLDRTVKSVLEWIAVCQNDPSENYMVEEVKYDYGKTIRQTIYCPGVGLVFSEQRDLIQRSTEDVQA